MSQHGALDSETSIQIMNLLKEIAKDKLVIMVTHNPELAEQYSTRIVRLKDGKIIGDTNPFDGKDVEQTEKKSKKKLKTSMGIFTALSLSLNNLLTKKGRTFLTAVAGSIGIIGIALILALSNGVRNYISEIERDTMTSQPVTIEKTTMDLGEVFSSALSGTKEKKVEGTKDKITLNDDISTKKKSSQLLTKENNLKKFKSYLENDDNVIKENALSIQYDYKTDMQIFSKEDGSIIKIHPVSNSNSLSLDTSSKNDEYSLKNVFKELNNSKEMFENDYEIISGKMPSAYNEVILMVDENGVVPLSTMYTLGIENREEYVNTVKDITNGAKVNKKEKTYNYDELIGKDYKLILNSSFYAKEYYKWVDKSNDTDYLEKLYNEGYDLKIVGIAKSKKSGAESGFVGYTYDLVKFVGEKNNESEIAKEQFANKKKNVLTGEYFDNISNSYEENLLILGMIEFDNPEAINIYPKSFEAKNNIKNAIEEYNSKVENDDKIKYSDMMEALISQITNIVNIIAYVLIAIVAISLVVSSIMISIITYISVLERTKEIGILRAIGASKKDVKRVFRAETIIEGLISGVLGVLVSLIICFIANIIINTMISVPNVASLPALQIAILIAVSVLLTVIAGMIPSGMASKKDPVETLRSE